MNMAPAPAVEAFEIDSGPFIPKVTSNGRRFQTMTFQRLFCGGVERTYAGESNVVVGYHLTAGQRPASHRSA